MLNLLPQSAPVPESLFPRHDRMNRRQLIDAIRRQLTRQMPDIAKRHPILMEDMVEVAFRRGLKSGDIREVTR